MENNFAGKTACSFVLPWSRGKIEKSFSPKLTDYFIQGVRNKISITRGRSPGLSQERM